MSLLGFPIFRYIDINDSEEVLRAIHLTDPEIPIDLVLQKRMRPPVKDITLEFREK